MSTLGSRIRAAREARGLTQDDVARHFGIKRVSVTQWESDTTKPALGRVADLAELLGVAQEDLLKGGRSSGAPRQPKSRTDTQRPDLIPGADLVGARDFPVYAAAMGGKGHHIVTFEQIETVKRPSILEGVRNAYALLVSGDSMRPAFRHGDLALVHPGLHPARDEVHIFYDHPPFGEAGDSEAMIKNLVGWTEKQWHLEQYNPAEEFKVDKVDWPVIHRVVGRYNRR